MLPPGIDDKHNLSKNLLKNALDDPIRKSNGLNILFGDREKDPHVKGWTHWCDPKHEDQTDGDITSFFKKREDQFTNWGYAAGYNNLTCIDTDWQFIYDVLKQKFGKRLDTLTFETPNLGKHLLFDCKGMTSEDTALVNNRHKDTLHVEVFTSKRYVACYGEAEDCSGELKPYKITNNAPIKKDRTIAKDVLEYLDELLKTKYKFVTYNCFKTVLGKKKVHLNHDVRISIASFLLHDGCTEEETRNFFKICTDYNNVKTKQQVASIVSGMKEKRYGHPKCETLRTELKCSLDDCRNCVRKLSVDRDPEFSLTDAGNAKRFKAAYETEVRYNHTVKSWYVWNGIKWEKDETDKVMQRAKNTAISILEEARYVSDDHKRNALIKHERYSESVRGLKSMID
jgi:hypothetical protein